MTSLAIWRERLETIIFNAASDIKPILGTKIGNQRHNQGAGGDITLEIDRRVEDFIIQSLKTYEEPFKIISEEIGEYSWPSTNVSKKTQDQQSLEKPQNYFIIDPIDGSTNAKRGIPIYCISIAYGTTENYQDLSLGLVLNIPTQDLYVGIKNHGAFLNGKPISCSSTSNLTKAIGSTDLDKNRMIESLKPFKNTLLKKAHRMRVLGSCAIELCLVAQGSLDFYIDFRGIVRIVDIAAALLILQEAGGKIVQDHFSEIPPHQLSLETKYSLFAYTSSLELQIEGIKTKFLSKKEK